MILSKIYENLTPEQQEAMAFGLVVGLAGGLVVGLAFGLAFGLVVGLVVGLAFGLAFGLVVGLAGGLVVGLVFGLVEIISKSLLAFPYVIALIVIILTLSEVLFFLGKEKPDKKSDRLLFTLRYKLESLLEASVIIINILNVILNWKSIQGFLGQMVTVAGQSVPLVVAALQVIGAIGLIIVVGYVYIWLNSKKYKDKTK